MMMFTPSLSIKLLVAVAIAALEAFFIWSWTSDYYQAKCDALKGLQAEAAAIATANVLTIERSNAAVATKLEVKYVQTRNKLDKALNDNRSLANKLGGLHDPFASTTRCDLSKDTSTTSTATNETAGSRLSAEASEFLLKYAREADSAAEYANTCHEWVKVLQSN